MVNKISICVIGQLIMFVGAMFFLSSCSTFITKTQNNITSRSVSNDLNFYVNKSKAILACVNKPGGDCQDMAVQTDDVSIAHSLGYKSRVVRELLESSPITISNLKEAKAESEMKSFMEFIDEANVTAAKFAAAAVTNSTEDKLEALYQEATGADDSTRDKSLVLSKNEVRQYAKCIQQATSFNGWAQFRYYLQNNLTKMKNHSAQSLDDKAKIIAIESTIRQLTLVEAYLIAYFENGSFVSLDIDASNAEASAIEVLREKYHVTESVAKEMTTKLLTQIIGTNPDGGKYHLLAKMKDGGFVTRGGTKYAFPGISSSVDLFSNTAVKVSKLDFTEIGADVVRVYLEAIGDQWGQLPADQTSTACKSKNAGHLDKFEKLKCYVESEQKVKAAEFTKVNEMANQAESLAATATGQAVRGISWISLNNEALAKLIETAVGVVARKAAEKVTWCVYACTAENKLKSGFYGNSTIHTIPLSVER